MNRYGVAILLAALCATPALAGPINGGFESGDLTGWTADGTDFYETGVIQDLVDAFDLVTPFVSPTEGSNMALVVGEVFWEDEASLTSDSFTTGALAETLSLDYNFVTFEFTNTPGEAIDSFAINLLDGAGGFLQELASGDTSSSDFFFIDDVVPNPGTSPADAGIIFAEELGWKSVSASLDANTSYRIEFVVTDDFSGPFDFGDTGLLVDNVKTDPVPEPGTWALIAGGMAFFWARRRRNRT